MPEGHEGREIYGVIADPHPDKGRALGRLEEKQGRRIEKTGGQRSSLPSGDTNTGRTDADIDRANERADR